MGFTRNSTIDLSRSAWEIKTSTSLRDDEWDQFVEFDAQGHFEQTSRWGEVKNEVGWKTLRILVYQGEGIAAGAQILLRRLPLIGAIGYLPKGPLFRKNDPGLVTLTVEEMKKALKKNRVLCLIVQSPYGGFDMDRHLGHVGFKRDVSFGIISATTAIDLTRDCPTLLSRMTRNFRYNIRFAERNGVIIRQGTEKDIPLFFQMMLKTCRRQGVDPNPAAESSIERLWFAFPKTKLFLAEYREKIISGLIGIPFGKSFYAWKMGWTGEYEDLRANHLLHWKAIQLAREEGCITYDFMGINRPMAEAILNGSHFFQVASGSDLFKLSFGGKVILLPETNIYISSPIVRLFYNEMFPGIRRMYSKIRKYPFFNRVEARA